MTDTRDLHDDDLRTLVRAAGAPAGRDFRADLRARLAAAIDGDVQLEPSRPGRTAPTWLTAAAAAAVLALLVGAIVLVTRDRDPEVGTASNVAAQLIGPTWVALDTSLAPQVPALVFTRDADGTLRLSGTASDGCNEVSGTFRLVDEVITAAELESTAMYCGPDLTARLQPGARLTLAYPTLTLDDGERQTVYRALESLDSVAGARLDGLWAAGPIRVRIVDGEVTGSGPDPVPEGDWFPAELSDALSAGVAEAWAYGESLIVRTPMAGLRRLDPAGPERPIEQAEPEPATLLDELVGRTWVGVGGDWQTAAPTLVFDSLNRERGLAVVTVFDGCNTGEGTFALEGATMVATAIGMTKIGCPHAIADLADGTNLAVTDGANLTATATDGLTTFYVALDSLPAMSDDPGRAGLDGAWVIAGAEFSITGETAQTADGGEELAAVVARAIAADPVKAWRYADGWILAAGDTSLTYLQLVPSDLPYGVDPVVTTGDLEFAEEALITGTVELVRGCLVVREGDLRWPIVWQPGTTWDRSTGRVVLPGGVILARGSRIEAGGGYHAVGDLGFFGVDDVGIATITRCAGGLAVDEIAVVQSPVTPSAPG